MNYKRAAEIAESWVNGNISWVREQVGNSARKYAAVRAALAEMAPDCLASFDRIVGQVAS